VARYGGEEFVMLCADCGNAAAARRAEQIRKAFSSISQPRMNDRASTVTIGVTEVQAGDTPETMLRRADRALLLGKSKGRNCVVQLGAGAGDEAEVVKEGSRFFGSGQPTGTLQQDLVTSVPVKIAVEKLRGFIADHQAKVNAIKGNEVDLEIDDCQLGLLRRNGDRPVTFSVHLRFDEERFVPEKTEDAKDGRLLRTRIQITVAPRRNRDRRRDDVLDRARQVLVSFRSYLMADEAEPATIKGTLTRVKRALTPWLIKR
jgi:hypothetical protein